MGKETYLKIIVWLLGCGGGMFIFIGGLVGFIYKSHTSDSDRRFAENREDHIRIFDELKNKQDRRKK